MILIIVDLMLINKQQMHHFKNFINTMTYAALPVPLHKKLALHHKDAH
jgi:hypothetical protein